MKKLIAEYQDNIDIIDKKIKYQEKTIEETRKDTERKLENEGALTYRRVLIAKRTIYVQVIKDLEDYEPVFEALDYIIECQYGKNKTLANLNGTVSNAKKIIKKLNK